MGESLVSTVIYQVIVDNEGRGAVAVNRVMPIVSSNNHILSLIITVGLLVTEKYKYKCTDYTRNDHGNNRYAGKKRKVFKCFS